MPEKIFTRSCSVIALTLGLALLAMPAYAGFQWVTPPGSSGAYQQPDAPSSYQQPSNGSVPRLAATNAPEIISPVIISGELPPAQANTLPSSYGATPASGSLAASAPHLATSSSPKAGESLSLATATISAPAAAPLGGDIVQGFASQIPLALALRQILPVGYSFSIDQNVDMDTLVSYKGNKSWRETLKEMLSPAGLTGREQGSAVTVSRTGSASSVQSLADSVPPSAPLPTRSVERVSAQPSFIDTPSMNVNSADGWSAQRGDTLRKALTDWCHRSGVELQWLAEYDYPIEASAHFNGSFEDAVRNLLAGFDGARPQPIGELHNNSNAGQRVLVVQARGNNYSN